MSDSSDAGSSLSAAAGAEAEETSTINTSVEPQIELSQTAAATDRPTSSSTTDPPSISSLSSPSLQAEAEQPRPSSSSASSLFPPPPAAESDPAIASPEAAATGAADQPASTAAVEAELSFSTVSDPSSLTSTMDRSLSSQAAQMRTVQQVDGQHDEDVGEAEMVLLEQPAPPAAASSAPAAASLAAAALASTPYADDPLADPHADPASASSLRPTSSFRPDDDEGLQHFPPGFYYAADSEALCQRLRPFQLSPAFLQLHQSFAFNCQQRYNLHYLGNSQLLFIAGNTAQILDSLTGKKTILPGHSQQADGGVASLAVHPSRRCFAVAEKGREPCIYIYSYPALSIIRILRRGTEAAYSHVEYSRSGDKLASVGSAPDFTLSIWDWQHERIILRTKAFSQEVQRVSFSPSDDGRLISSGVGHIRFWAMARTFTGLKLQGSIGKFGGVELSDISAFIELPDGRVLSGSESGVLLMWDAHLIQYQVVRLDGSPCHSGPVTCLWMRGGHVMSAGDDGFIRVWAYSALEYAEVSEDDAFVRVAPLQEVRPAAGCRIAHVVEGEEDEWLVQDSAGGIHSYHVLSQHARTLLTVHAGAINAVVASPTSHVAVTAAADRTVRCWDFYHGKLLYTRSFTAAATVLTYAPPALDPQQQTVMAGFEDGTVRTLQRYLEAFRVVGAWKPHRRAARLLAVSGDGRLLATVGEGGELFFFAMAEGGRGAQDAVQALGCLRLEAEVRSLCFDATSRRLLLACGAKVVELEVPDAAAAAGAERESYVLDLKRRDWSYDIRHQPSEGEEERQQEREAEDKRWKERGSLDMTDEEAEQEKLRREAREERRRQRATKRKEEEQRLYDVSAVLYAPHSTSSFFFTLAAPPPSAAAYPPRKVETLYEASFASPVPSRAVHLGSSTGAVSSLSYSLSGSFLLLGTASGSVSVRSCHELQYGFISHHHDAAAAVTGVSASFDDRFLLTAAGDGQMFCYAMDAIGALAVCDRTVQAQLDIERERSREKRREKAKKRAEEDDKRRKERRERTGRSKDDKVKADKTETKDAADDAPDSDTEDDEEEQLSHLSTTARAAPIVTTSAAAESSPSSPSLSSASAACDLPAPVSDALTTSLAVSDVSDSLTAGSYSIEEAAAKAEEDERQRDLKRQQRSIEEEMGECRDQYSRLMQDKEGWEQRVAQLGLDAAASSSSDLFRLPAPLFDLDPELPQHMSALTAQRKAELQSSLAFSIELHNLQMQKLRSHFLQDVETESFQVTSFRVDERRSRAAAAAASRSGAQAEQEDEDDEAEDGGSVWSYRVTRLPDWLVEEIATVHRRVEEEEAAKRRQEEERQRRLEAEQNDNAVAASAEQQLVPSLDPSDPQSLAADGGSVSAMDGRYAARQMRQRQMDALLQARPAVGVLSASEQAVLQAAEDGIGDYKLKSADDYIVPEGKKVNVERKRRRMLLILEAVHAMKQAFNARLHDMRGVKLRIRDGVRRDLQTVREIQRQLAASRPTLKRPSATAEEKQREEKEETEGAEFLSVLERLLSAPTSRYEWPERRGDFTEEELHAFVKRKKAEEKRRAGAARGVGDGDDVEEETPASASPSPVLPVPAAAQRQQERRERDPLDDESGLQEAKTQDEAEYSADVGEQKTAYDLLDRTQCLLQRQQLRASLRGLLSRIRRTLHSFNAALASHAAARLRLDDDLSNAELRLLLCFDELSVLREYEEKERTLEDRGRRLRDGKAALIGEMAQVEAALNARMKELQLCLDKEKLLFHDFVAAVGGEKNEFYSILLRLYRRKVKRRKAAGGKAKGDKKGDDGGLGGDGGKDGKGEGRQHGGGGGEGGESDDNSDSDGDSDASDAESDVSSSSSLRSDSDEDEEDSSCPPHCPAIAYDKTLELRERRLDNDEAVDGLQRGCSESAKVYERLQGKVKALERDERQLEREVQSFQSEKQRALNTIELALPLHISQIAHVRQRTEAEGGGGFALPSSLSDGLLFTRAAFARLHRRSAELETERQAVEAEFAALRRSSKSIQRDMADWQRRIAEEEKRCQSVQLLKFGRLVDLHFILDDDGAKQRHHREKQQRLAEMEQAQRGVVRRWQEELEAARRGYGERMQLNTQLLERVGELTSTQYELEGRLNASVGMVQGVSGGMPGGVEEEEEKREREELLRLVETQEREIEQLKAEMGMLRRKGGHVYTAV